MTTKNTTTEEVLEPKAIIDLSKCTAEELEAALQSKKEAEKRAEEKKKAQYEDERNDLVDLISKNVKSIHDTLKQFKEELHVKMDEQAARLSEYGAIRSNSKGGFSILSKDGNFKITRVRATEPVWDERSTKAIELVEDFLSSTVKKHNKKLYEILITFISRNQNGDLEYQKVMNLVAHEDKYSDSRWKEGLKLIKESYSVHLRAYQYEFKQKNAQGSWVTVPINFTSL